MYDNEVYINSHGWESCQPIHSVVTVPLPKLPRITHSGNTVTNTCHPQSNISIFNMQVNELSITTIFDYIQSSIQSLLDRNLVISSHFILYTSLQNEFQLDNIKGRAIRKADGFQLPNNLYTNDLHRLQSCNYNWNDFILSYRTIDRFNKSSCIHMFAGTREYPILSN